MAPENLGMVDGVRESDLEDRGIHGPSPAGEPLVRVSQLSMVGFQSEDVDRLVDYYETALSFVVTESSDGVVYLTTGPQHHCIAVTAGSHRARSFLGLQIEGSLEDAERRLKEGGVPVERRTDPQPGVAAALVIEEPDGAPLLLFEGQAMSGTPSSAGPRPLSLGHVAAFSGDVGVAERFYLDVLGFRWSDSIDDWFTFLRCDQDHHAVNFLRQPGVSGMHHIAFKMRDIVHLKDVLDHLAQLGRSVEWGPGRHGPGHNIFTYHKDPDGNRIELFTEIDIVIDERTGQFAPRPWHEEHPQYPKVWPTGPTTANRWGPLGPEMNSP